MTHDEIKAFIADRTREGHNLSKIQDMLAERGVKMTFMELRLIASEIETSFWQQSDPKPEPAPEPKQATQEPAPADETDNFPEDEPGAEELPPDDAAAGEAPAADGEAKPRGRTTVTLDQLARPGFLATGGVQFGSGASGNWCLDQMGRLMFEKLEGKPDRQDLQEFQLELQRMFAN
ncbi:MAG: hypothetical protein IKQ16_03410 [Lentisphaeria bacterium]|jgi:hypothetical protein|nr:hypothetical protein [Lentisphaeria bacterium]